MTITKDTILGDILDAAPETAPLFIEIGMHCLGCPSARSETVEQACYVHGQDVDALPCGYFLRSFFFLLSFIYYLLFVEKDTLTPSRGNKDVFTLLKIHV